MKTLVPHLRKPFRSPNLLSGGATAHIFAISVDIVVKVPLQFDNPTPGLRDLADEAVKSIEHEKNMYKLIAQRRHPNFVQCFLCTADGIFLQRIEESLRTRLEQQNERPISDQAQHRWVKQIASAAVWLEQLDYFHGDLRPANILLDQGHVKLCDFGNTTKRGEELPGTSSPFYRPGSIGCASPLAGPASEQFAIGSCIYTIRTGHEPLAHLGGPEMVQALIRGDFPATDADSIFGHIVSDCWHAEYETLADVERAIRAALPHCEGEKGASLMEPRRYEDGVFGCREFLNREGRLVGSEERG